MYHLVLYFRLQDVNLMRIFKTVWFNREAKSHTIKDDELSEAINAVLQGKADNLGGGVYKNVSIKTAIAQSYWQREANIGFTPSCMPNRIWPTLAIANLRVSVS